jgi:hypothetical protein
MWKGAEEVQNTFWCIYSFVKHLDQEEKEKDRVR